MSLKVLLVTTWNAACGISEHSAYLKEAVEAADPEIDLIPDPTALDPAVFGHAGLPAICHLNYQAALHSRWQPETIRRVQQLGVKVIVTWHDSGAPNSDLCKAIVDAADAAVVHEPFDDLPLEEVRYWRMGVPDWPGGWYHDHGRSSWCGDRPILGTVGFPFPWKNYDELARVTAACGWALLLIAPTATAADVARWAAINPHLYVETSFLPRDTVISQLAACDATAFLYTCANTGQSGAICQGIAARKPVIAFSPSICRQFRCYEHEPAIRWCSSEAQVRVALRTLPIQRCDPGIVELAHRDSWAQLGRKYAALYHNVGGG
jgi:hypothetical protein